MSTRESKSGLTRWLHAGIGLLSGLVLSGSALGQVGMGQAADRLGAEVNSLLNVRASQIVTLDVNWTPGVAQSFVVPFDGADYTLDLYPATVRAPGYQVLVQGPDGSFTPGEIAAESTLRGVVVGDDSSVAGASLMDDGLHGSFIRGDGERIWIQPLVSVTPNADLDEYVVYRQSDVLPNNGLCGTADADADPIDEIGLEDGMGGQRVTIYTAQLACDADVEYYNRWGGVSGVQNRVNTIVNQVNVQYERDVQITHVITAIIVRTSEPDPYSSTDPSTLLSQFRTEWINNQGAITRDLAHLFTNKNINGGVIGIAWTIGGVCTSSAYCLSQAECCGSLSCATDLVAHECGHIWGASHCTCDNPPYTMNPYITCANIFSAGSISQIIAHRNSRTCLTTCGGTITSDPAPQTKCAGETAQFSITTDIPSPTYRWRKDGVNLNNGGDISGVTTATLTIANVDFSDAGNYDCRVTAGTCDVLSNAAALTVNVCSQLTSFVKNNTAPTGGADIGTFDRNSTHHTFDMVVDTVLAASDWTGSEYSVDVVAPALGQIWHASDQTNFGGVPGNLNVPFLPDTDTSTKIFDTFAASPGAAFFIPPQVATPGMVSTNVKIRGLSGQGEEVPLTWFDTAVNSGGVIFTASRLTFETYSPATLNVGSGDTLFATITGRTSTANTPGGVDFSASIYYSASGEPCPWDLDNDGTIELDDLSVVLVHFGMTSGATLEDGDFDGDGDVDLDDLSELLVRFGQACP